MRKERRQLVFDFLADEIRQRDVDVAAVLPHQLPARTAWRRRLFRLRYDRDRREFALAGGQRGEQGDALGAHCQSVCAVLYVAAAEDFSGLRSQSCADLELRKWSDCVLARRFGFFDEGDHGGRKLLQRARFANSDSMSRHSSPSSAIRTET